MTKFLPLFVTLLSLAGLLGLVTSSPKPGYAEHGVLTSNVNVIPNTQLEQPVFMTTAVGTDICTHVKTIDNIIVSDLGAEPTLDPFTHIYSCQPATARVTIDLKRYERGARRAVAPSYLSALSPAT